MGRKYKNIDVSSYVCQNEECSVYRRENKEGHVKFHHYDKKIMYLKCTICGKIFSENRGRIFFRKKTPRDIIIRALKATSEGTGIRATGRIFDKNKNTILNWVREAGSHCEELEKFFQQSGDS